MTGNLPPAEIVYTDMSASDPDSGPDYTELAVGAGAYLLTVLILLRIRPGLAVALLLLGVLGAAGYFGYLFYRGYRKGRANYAKGDDFGLRIRARLRECERKEEQFRTEANHIRQTIADLRTDIERSAGADESEVERARQLITDFEAEFNLRHAKASFFADCAAKLKALRDRYDLQQSIARRKRELDDLRATNLDDEATLEETRYHLERDTIELNTIVELSREAFVSFKAEQAEELRQRLEKLRGEL